MRVVYIGNFRPQFSTENEVLHALTTLGHVVTPVQEDGCDWLGLVAGHRDAEMILWTHTHDYASGDVEVLCDQMLADAEEAGIPTVAYHLDRWWGLEREQQVMTEPFFRCSLVVTADGGHQADFEAWGINHVWLPPAVSERWCHRGVPRLNYRRDIGFVGSWMAYGHEQMWPWRKELVQWLMRTYRSRFRAWPRNGVSVRGDELCDLYASLRVVVGDSCLAGGATHYWSDRVPETLGRGGLLLHPEVDGLREHFPGLLPLTFPVGDFTALRETIERALDMSDDEHRAATDEAMRCVIEEHTYTVRMRQVIEHVTNKEHADADES